MLLVFDIKALDSPIVPVPCFNDAVPFLRKWQEKLLEKGIYVPLGFFITQWCQKDKREIRNSESQQDNDRANLDQQ